MTSSARAGSSDDAQKHARGDSATSLVASAASTTAAVTTTRLFEMSDFVTVDSIGEGSYSSVREVFLADKPSERYALKVMDKAHIVREEKARYVATERTLLATRL